MSPIEWWGALMVLARRASHQATEHMRRAKVISDPLQSSILLYTDDPITAGLFAAEQDMAAICGVSAIEGVHIMTGDRFPPDAFEALANDHEMPRVAAMWFRAPRAKCPRCRNYIRGAQPALRTGQHADHQ